jgi:translation initiation factor 4E
VTFRNSQRKILNHVWLELTLMLIGDTMTDPEQVAGAVVSVRARNCRVALWTQKSQDEAACKRLGAQLKELAQCTDTVHFISNTDAINDGKTAKPLYQV